LGPELMLAIRRQKLPPSLLRGAPVTAPPHGDTTIGTSGVEAQAGMGRSRGCYAGMMETAGWTPTLNARITNLTSTSTAAGLEEITLQLSVPVSAELDSGMTDSFSARSLLEASLLE